MTRQTWLTREAVLLEAIAAAEEAGEEARADQLAESTGLGTRQTELGLRALYDAEYIDGAIVTGLQQTFDILDIRLLERGLRAIGQWPADDAYAALLAVLEERIAGATTTNERNGLERFREAVVAMGRDVAVSVLAAWARYLGGPPMTG